MRYEETDSASRERARNDVRREVRARANPLEAHAGREQRAEGQRDPWANRVRRSKPRARRGRRRTTVCCRCVEERVPRPRPAAGVEELHRRRGPADAHDAPRHGPRGHRFEPLGQSATRGTLEGDVLYLARSDAKLTSSDVSSWHVLPIVGDESHTRGMSWLTWCRSHSRSSTALPKPSTLMRSFVGRSFRGPDSGSEGHRARPRSSSRSGAPSKRSVPRRISGSGSASRRSRNTRTSRPWRSYTRRRSARGSRSSYVTSVSVAPSRSGSIVLTAKLASASSGSLLMRCRRHS
jgi:hypothetical protein